ncbi:hypothetical protein Nmel_013055 [Mimus melanotis]
MSLSSRVQENSVRFYTWRSSQRMQTLGAHVSAGGGRRSTSLNMCLSNPARGTQCLQHLNEIYLL